MHSACPDLAYGFVVLPLLLKLPYGTELHDLKTKTGLPKSEKHDTAPWQTLVQEGSYHLSISIAPSQLCHSYADLFPIDVLSRIDKLIVKL